MNFKYSNDFIHSGVVQNIKGLCLRWDNSFGNTLFSLWCREPCENMFEIDW